MASRSTTSEALVTATVELIESWAPHPTPAWVTSIPSQARPTLVSDFAERVAASLQLPYVESLRRSQSTPPQSEMDNSSQQARNALDGLEVSDVLEGPVILIDDTVDSRWTLTAAASKLRAAGSGPVSAMALADTSRA